MAKALSKRRPSCGVYRVGWIILGVGVHHNGVCPGSTCGHKGTCIERTLEEFGSRHLLPLGGFQYRLELDHWISLEPLRRPLTMCIDRSGALV